MIPGVPDLSTYVGLGWFASEQFGKKAPQNQAQAPQQAQAQQAQPQVQQNGAGALVGAQRRAPVGPVALDWDIDEQTEIDVWRCIRDRNLAKASSSPRPWPLWACPWRPRPSRCTSSSSARTAWRPEAAAAVEIMHHVQAPAPAPAPRVAAPRRPAPRAPTPAPAGRSATAPAGSVISAAEAEEPNDVVAAR